MNAKTQMFGFKLNYDNSYQLLFNFLQIYSTAQNIVNGDNYLRPRLIEILAYYMLKGYSNETKDYIIENERGLNRTNLNQINCELTNKGFLKRDRFKYHTRTLAKELIELKDYVLNNKETPIFTILFKKNEN